MAENVSAECCVVGGGPAGMMLGLLLARSGVRVTVLEKHKDFLRDFRGDTVHPSTLQIMQELGLLEEFLKLPHTKIRTANMEIGDEHLSIGDFTRLPTACKFIALMPQWDFLNFIAEEAKAYPTFKLLMRAEVTGLAQTGEHGFDDRDHAQAALGVQHRRVAHFHVAHVFARGVFRVFDLGQDFAGAIEE